MDNAIRAQLTEDLDFVSTCLKRLALRSRNRLSLKVFANIGTDSETVFDYFHNNATPLQFDLRLEVSDQILLDHVKDRLRKIGAQWSKLWKPPREPTWCCWLT